MSHHLSEPNLDTVSPFNPREFACAFGLAFLAVLFAFVVVLLLMLPVARV